MNSTIGHFPSGQPILPVRQADRSPKRVFVLGVYASAVHARWTHPNGRTRISALAVASEPDIFWTGQGADKITAGIQTPDGSGRLVPAGANLNGPSGRALDERILSPLGDHPLRWFAAHCGAHPCLSDYGTTPATYGQLHPLAVSPPDALPAFSLLLLPLAHPRQIARLGTHSDRLRVSSLGRLAMAAPPFLVDLPLAQGTDSLYRIKHMFTVAFTLPPPSQPRKPS